jgi:RimJ/RimL family protein N-acetyltransferase
METLRAHDTILRGERITLRPMTEGDWDVLYRWENDAEVLYYCDGDDVTGYALEDVQMIFRGVSQLAFSFSIECEGQAIGWCWLQAMNMPAILARFPALDCRRIDLAIGAKHFWSQGLGTEAIRLLTIFAFERERADAVFGVSIANYNPRSCRAFEKNGYQLTQVTREPEGRKATLTYEVMLTREQFLMRNANSTA